jgi:hypothetical protein
MKKLLIVLVLLLTSFVANGQLTKQVEKYYQDKFALIVGGKKEVILDDKTRVDIVTDTFAIEVDFADKWAESIGQSYHYGKKLNKKAGILLVVNGKFDDRFVQILMPHATELGITVWVMDYNTDKYFKIKPVIIYPYEF